MSTTLAKPVILFVHGLWADASCWNKVIGQLQAEGYECVAAQNPTTSLADDVAAVNRAMNRTQGPVILVGHSWAGMVITQFAEEPRVKALVYIAAHAPDANESVNYLLKQAPANHLQEYLVTSDGFITLSEEGMRKGFAQDLAAGEQKILFATQTPAAAVAFDDKSATPAWKTKPSWDIIARHDEIINPELERMMAKRANAKTYEVNSSHVVMLSKPQEVVNVIHDAIKTVQAE